MLTYGSVCSGIEAASVAWHPLGWRAAFVSEIDPFPCAVLAHHYPDVPNYGDMTRYRDWPDADLDVLVGGTPCQSFSVAGLRSGLADPRGNLALVFLGLADRYRPRWLAWENVPGVLSSNRGRDFGTFLGALAELGYGWAYRVLDAQYVRVDGLERAVPQRRRRVFVVGYRGDWRRAAAVLFERESLHGHTPPRRSAGEEVAATLASRARSGGGVGPETECPVIAVRPELPLAWHPPIVPQAMSSKWAKGASGQAIAVDLAQITSAANRSTPQPVSPTLHQAGTVYAIQERAVSVNPDSGPDGVGIQADHAYTLEARPHVQAVAVQCHMVHGGGVRRLTPRECERLQGFPDDWTLVPYRGKVARDSPRYKSLGNSMAVNCMRWIGRRIETVEAALAAAPDAGRVA